MADDCCGRIIGGLVTLRADDKTYEITGDITIDWGGEEREASSTASGATVITVKPMPVRLTMDIANICGDSHPRNLWLLKCKAQVTVVEKSRGIRHLLTNASIVGSPKGNKMTGVVTGIEIVCDPIDYTEA
jgi:hypothetical protein